MFRYYCLLQALSMTAWMLLPTGTLPIWAVFLPALACVLHFGVTLLVAMVAMVIIFIVSQSQKKVHKL